MRERGDSTKRVRYRSVSSNYSSLKYDTSIGEKKTGRTIAVGSPYEGVFHMVGLSRLRFPFKAPRTSRHSFAFVKEIRAALRSAPDWFIGAMPLQRGRGLQTFHLSDRASIPTSTPMIYSSRSFGADTR